MFIKLAEISAFNINSFPIYFLLCLVQEKKDDIYAGIHEKCFES